MAVKRCNDKAVVSLLILLLTGVVAAAMAGEAVLKVSASSGKSASVEMASMVPVRGVQFTVNGAKITEVRTTDRTKGFLTKFNDANGMVILLSTLAESIPPGKGAIAEIMCDTPAEASISEIKIVYTQ